MKAEPSMEQILASIRKIMAEEAAGNAPESMSMENNVSKTDNSKPETVLELTDPLEEETSSSTPSSTHLQNSSEIPAPIITNEMVTNNQLPEENPMNPSLLQPAFHQTAPHSLLSENVKNVGINAFQELLHISEKIKEPMPMQDSIKGKTIDDLIADLMRPLLSSWLNQNLPNLVERLVKEEIRKLVERV